MSVSLDASPVRSIYVLDTFNIICNHRSYYFELIGRLLLTLNIILCFKSDCCVKCLSNGEDIQICFCFYAFITNLLLNDIRRLVLKNFELCAVFFEERSNKSDAENVSSKRLVRT